MNTAISFRADLLPCSACQATLHVNDNESICEYDDQWLALSDGIFRFASIEEVHPVDANERVSVVRSLVKVALGSGIQ